MSFSKSWNWTSRFGECNFIFLKNSQVQVNSKLNGKDHMITYELYKHEKIWLRKCRKIFFEAIFSHPGKLFSKFLHIIFVHILRDIIGLEDLLFSFSQSQSGITMCKFEDSELFTKRERVEFGTTEHKPSSGRDRRICTTVDLWLFCMEQRDLRD